jgi:hypothetical protein
MLVWNKQDLPEYNAQPSFQIQQYPKDSSTTFPAFDVDGEPIIKKLPPTTYIEEAGSETLDVDLPIDRMWYNSKDARD